MTWLLGQESAAPGPVGTTLDYVVVVGYMVLILGFGSFFGRFAKSTKDFFFGGAKFSWWLIGLSMVATGVGSHSFAKYAEKGFTFGLSSGMSYMNDWFFIPFFMFGWLPLVYFSRVRSVPEYFERRFNTPCRFVAVLINLSYMLMYIGYNLYTLGEVVHQVLGIEVRVAIFAIAVVSGVYITAGGQTAVIFTDLLQGFMLLFAGLLVFALGLDALVLDGGIVAGIQTLWQNLSLEQRLPFSGFNEPANFSFVGVFWQDGVAGSFMFLFISQGLLMRFLAAKSVNEGRKTILFNTIFILPISMIVVGNAGWICRVLVDTGTIAEPESAKRAFVTVAEYVCKPGIFGFVLAALSAALMSTMDTFTNACAALFVYDVYQPYIKKNASDRHYMKVARFATVATTLTGLGLGLFFSFYQKSDLYSLHGWFTSLITPPIVVTVVLGAFWKRFTSAAALATLVMGTVALYAAQGFPDLVWPFATWLHGVPAPEEGGAYRYMTALYGLVVSAAIGVTVTYLTKPKTDEELRGLWVGSVEETRKRYKGGTPNDEVGEKVRVGLTATDERTTQATKSLNYDDHAAGHIPEPDPVAPQVLPEYAIVRLAQDEMERLKANPGDLLYIADARWWLGGLRSLHCRAGEVHDQPGKIWVHPAAADLGSLLPDRDIRVEKFF